jgi:hypothetical protein
MERTNAQPRKSGASVKRSSMLACPSSGRLPQARLKAPRSLGRARRSFPPLSTKTATSSSSWSPTASACRNSSLWTAGVGSETFYKASRTRAAKTQSCIRGCLRGVKRIDKAITLAASKGDHHKAWVIDQMVRVLAGDLYGDIVVNAKLAKRARIMWGYRDDPAPCC